jgi:hypothetical protein
MIELVAVKRGVILPVQAQPQAGRNSISGEFNGRLKVAVTAVPEKGKANSAIIKVLAKQLGIPKSKISLISGETSKQKKFLITEIDLSLLEKKLAEFC